MSIVIAEYRMSAGNNAVWGGPAPSAQVVEETRDGRTVYVARSPWSEQAYASQKQADAAARRLARG